MLCDKCKKRTANVLIRKMVNGKSTEMYLCEQCTKESEELGFMMGSDFSLQNIFAGLLDIDSKLPGMDAGLKDESGKCPQCGMTYQDFKRRGLLGCGNCYEVFRAKLEPVLRRIHGQTRHTGKLPQRRGGVAAKKRQIEELKTELNKAIEKEEFEQAAVLRDKIRETEKGSS